MKLTEKQARDIGSRVLKQLPKGWKANLWENRGWHVSWINGAISLHYSEHKKKQIHPFWTLTGPCNSGVGHLDFGRKNIRMYRDPRTAIKAACKEGKEVILTNWQPIIDSLNTIEKSLAEKK